MLGSFKIRLLMVIVMAAMVGLVMQSGHSSKRIMEPVLHYVMDANYDIQEVFSPYINLPGGDPIKNLPATTGTVLKMPCDFVDIERSYGWHWSKDVERTEFCPGIFFKVADNTLVKPILPGRVAEVQKDQANGTVRIQHEGELMSIYGGLKEIMVDKDAKVSEGQVLGKTGEHFYFEVRSPDGPVNPQSIFK